MKKCHKCGTMIELEKVSRRDECPSCGLDLRVCLNCGFYNQNKSNQCEEPQVEPVKEKDRANYCDYFQFREDGRKGSTGSARDSAQQAWDELFKKG
jgi:hypothetical protein